MKNISFINKLKTEPKFRKNVIAVTAAALVLVICAVSIPVGLHVRKSDVQKTAENITASVTEATTSTVDANEESTTEPTTLTAVVNETAAVPVATNQKQTDKPGTGNNGNPSSASNKTGNPSKPTTTKAPSTTKMQETTKANDWGWTRSDADAFAAKSISYGESIGLIYDGTLTPKNSCWQSSVWTSSKKNETKMFSQMKEWLDYHKNNKGAKYFNIWVEYDNEGYWDFTILWM